MPDLDIGSDVLVANLVDPPATQSSSRGPGAKGWASGVAGIKSAGYGLKAFGANLVGADSVRQQALTDAQALEQQAAADAMRVEDINSVGTAYDWGKYALASALPSILMSIAGGGAGRAVGALAARKAVTDSARTMLKDGGMLGGAGAASLGLGVGSIYPEALEEKVDNPALRAVIGGTASAALDVLPGYAFARKVGLIGDVAKQQTRRAGLGAYAKGVGATAGKGALIEGATEGAQEGIEAVAAGKDLTDPQVISAMLNAAATGAVAGTAFGAAGGAVDTARTPLAGTEPVLPPADINGPQPVSQPIDTIAADVQRTLAGGAVDLPVLAPEFSPVQDALARPVDNTPPTAVPDLYNRAESPVATDADLNQIDVLSRQRAELDSRLTEIGGKLAEPTTPRRDKVLLEREYTPLKAELDAVNAQIEGLSQGIRNREAMAEAPSGAITERTAAAQRQEPVVTEQINDTDAAELAVGRQKRERGLLVTKREADLMRAADRAAAAPAAVAVQEAPTFTSREKTKYVNDETRAKVVYDLANQSVEKNFADLPGSGKFTPAVRKQVTNALTAAIDKAATAPTIEASEKQIHDAAIKALAGKVNKDDAETFAGLVAADVRSAPTFYSKGAVDLGNLDKLPSDRLEAMEKQVGDQYVAGGMTFDEFIKRSDPITQAKVNAQVREQKIKSAGALKEATPGFKRIPEGVKVLATHGLSYREPTMATVVGTKTVQLNDGLYMLPRVDFGDGRARTLLPSDIKEVYAPRLVQGSFAAVLEDDGTGKPTVESYDAQQLALTDAGGKLTDGLFRIIPHDPNLEVKVYHAETGAPIGYYRRVNEQKSLIGLAVNAKEDVSLTMHEGLHYLEDRVLDARERAILNRGLKPGSPLFKRVIERTQQYDRDNKTQITDEVISNPREAHAYGFQFWQRGELQVDGALAKVFAKLQEFIERIANLINGLGFQSVEDIFRAIDLGQYRTRKVLEAQAQGDLAMASEGAARGWYRSDLYKQVTALPTKAASGQGWKDQIKGLVGKGLVKQAELDAVGLTEWLDLQQGKVTKEQVSGFLESNGVQVEEVVLGDTGGFTQEMKDELDMLESLGDHNHTNEQAQRMQRLIDAENAASEPGGRPAVTKFQQYQLPGGENYRELLLTLPGGESVQDAIARRDAAWTRISERFDYPRGQSDLYGLRWAEENVPGLYAEWQDASRAANKKPTASNAGTFRSSHFDQPNILAHIRFNERKDADGKRVLFIEEIQSDWAQKGKKEGFASKIASDPRVPELRRLQREARNGADRERFNTLWDEFYRDHNIPSSVALDDVLKPGVPAAPFVSSQKFGVFKENAEMAFDKQGDPVATDQGSVQRFSTQEQAEAFAKKYSAEVRDLGQQADTPAWVALSLKRMISYAAENGFDRVAWTTGEQQAARYALSAQVSSIEWSPILNTTKQHVGINTNKGIISLEVQDGKVVATKNQAARDNNLMGKPLEDIVGKEVAKKIESTYQGRLAGEGLDIGGEGMKAFYDKIVPNVANDVLKKLGGGKVGVVRVKNGLSHVNPETGEYIGDAASPLQGFDITPALRTKVLSEGAPLFSRAATPSVSQTLTAAFKRWFGNSKVVDAQGNPLRVYHGTSANINTFDGERVGDNFPEAAVGFYFSSDSLAASGYAKTAAEYSDIPSANVMPVYLSIKNPYRLDGGDWTLDDNSDLLRKLKAEGKYDGVVSTHKSGKTTYIAFKPEQIKSAIGNRGTFDSSNPNILYSRAALSPERQAALTDMQRRYEAGELEREQMMDATAASLQHMPDATWKQDIKAIAGSVPGGLKRWRLSNIASANYISRFSTGYANVQKTLLSYVQRKNNLIAEGVDVMLSEWRASGTAQADIDAVGRAMFARTEKGYLESSPEYAQLIAPLTTKQRRMFDQANNMIADRLRREFEVEQGTYQRLLPQAEYDEWFANRSTQVRKLIAEGYLPERRYGNYTVNIYLPSPDGKKITVHYEQFEMEAGAKVQAQRYAAHLAKVAPELRVETGHLHSVERDTSLSMQQFLDAASRYGIKLSQTERERIAKALIAADSMRRNRMFRRQNVPGYAKDTMRVLAEFAVTMANKVAYSEYSSAINDAIQGRPVDAQLVNGKPLLSTDASRDLWREDGPESGFYRNISDELVDHVLTPALKGEWSRKVRALTMLYFLGGSIAAGVVNMTSLPMNTMPWLSQYTPYTNAFARTSAAWTMTLKNQAAIRDIATLENRDISIDDVDNIPGLRDALVTAGKDGTTLDTEIYQIMGLTRGGLLAKSKTTQKAVEAWMLPFRFAEQTNRIATFVSAYRIGVDNKLTGRDLYKFAQDAVYNTQFRYDEVNRPALARDPLWAILFTFKSYPLFVVEMLETMYKQNPGSVVVMLLGLSFAAGIEGLPFAEDIMDLIDTISQKLFGSPFNTRRALRNVLKSASEAVIGVDASEVILRGVINEVTDMSIASRVGLGNLIPGTRIGTADTDYGKLLQEALGPVGSMVQSGAEGAGKVLKGDFLQALRDEGPLAMRNLVKGAQQLDRGYAQDAKGRKLADVSGMEAFWQAIGFSSANLAHAYESDMIDRQRDAFYTQVRDDFANSITKAIRDGDSATAQETLDAVQKWNAQYPEMPISFSPAVMRRNIMLSGLPLNERTLRTLPKQLRGSSLAAEGVPE